VDDSHIGHWQFLSSLFDAATSKSIISRFGNRRRGGDLVIMLQRKVALLVNIAHSRKFHEPTLE
jgi:hypothetical protein